MGCGASKETLGLTHEKHNGAKNRQVTVSTKKSTQNSSVPPGYSSGASLEEEPLPDEAPPLSKSNVLDLSNLRKEIAAEGDIAKCVVRIEVRFLSQNRGEWQECGCIFLCLLC